MSETSGRAESAGDHGTGTPPAAPVHPLADLLAKSRKPARLVIGLMSGTSADSIDVAICRLTHRATTQSPSPPTVQLIHYEEHPHDREVRSCILDCAKLDVRGIAELHVMLAETFAVAALKTLANASISPRDIDLIGSHGQTVYHHSGVPGASKATLQIGDGDVIAVRTGCPVISDFRARDIAAGGEGAPLSPIADGILFSSISNGSRTPSRTAVLNLGGIANLTVLDEDPANVFGFDTGPANAPLDRVARRISAGDLTCDQDARIARAGQINQTLLAALLANDPFLTRLAPKSTGFEMYGDAFVARAIVQHGACDAHLMATLTEFVARTVIMGLDQCKTLGAPVQRLVVAGGGARNPFLMERIQALAGPILVQRSDDLGIPSDAREAMIFAVLADMTLRGEPAWLPPVTGATLPKLLGKLSFP